uniref:Putative metalloprotease n=1 Tax=Ixodes ricinus TaxID=34613 RepID=A0A0K8RE33_IXORI
MLTSKKLANIKKGILDTTVAGYAFFAAICTAQRVGIVEDNGFSLQGVNSIAHELGHLQSQFECLLTEMFGKGVGTKRLPGQFYDSRQNL